MNCISHHAHPKQLSLFPNYLSTQDGEVHCSVCGQQTATHECEHCGAMQWEALR